MSLNKRKVYIIGVGLTKFERPGVRDWDYPDMGAEAIIKALEDAGISYNDVEQVACGYVYGDTTCGQRAVYKVGMTGIPIYNVNNACSTGSTAMYMCKQFIESGIAECTLALGFDKMAKGALTYYYHDRTSPLQRHFDTMHKTREKSDAPFAAQMFGNAAREHMEKYGTTLEQLAKVAYKNHKHSKLNPYAQFQKEFTLEQILKSPTVYSPLTLLQCCPTSEGAGAAIFASEDFVKKHGLEHLAIEVLAMSLKTDIPTAFEDSCIKMTGFDMTRLASEEVYQKTGYSPKDIQVLEVHDCFSSNELITYEALGLCPVGKGGELIDSGDVTYGGKWVVNPSGGLISKGHPLGGTGLAQIAELTWQLRGVTGKRQVKDCELALQHNIGLGGAVVVSLLKHGFPNKKKPYPSDKPNPAIVATSPKRIPDGEPMIKSSSASGPLDDIINQIDARIQKNNTLAQKIGAIYLFTIKLNNSKVVKYTLDLKSTPAKITQGESNSDVQITIGEEDFIDLMNGKLDPQNAYAKGKLKATGDLMLALKLEEVITPQSKL